METKGAQAAGPRRRDQQHVLLDLPEGRVTIRGTRSGRGRILVQGDVPEEQRSAAALALTIAVQQAATAGPPTRGVSDNTGRLAVNVLWTMLENVELRWTIASDRDIPEPEAAARAVVAALLALIDEEGLWVAVEDALHVSLPRGRDVDLEEDEIIEWPDGFGLIGQPTLQTPIVSAWRGPGAPALREAAGVLWPFARLDLALALGQAGYELAWERESLLDDIGPEVLGHWRLPGREPEPFTYLWSFAPDSADDRYVPCLTEPAIAPSARVWVRPTHIGPSIAVSVAIGECVPAINAGRYPHGTGARRELERMTVHADAAWAWPAARVLFVEEMRVEAGGEVLAYVQRVTDLEGCLDDAVAPRPNLLESPGSPHAYAPHTFGGLVSAALAAAGVRAHTAAGEVSHDAPAHRADMLLRTWLVVPIPAGVNPRDVLADPDALAAFETYRGELRYLGPETTSLVACAISRFDAVMAQTLTVGPGVPIRPFAHGLPDEGGGTWIGIAGAGVDMGRECHVNFDLEGYQVALLRAYDAAPPLRVTAQAPG